MNFIHDIYIYSFDPSKTFFIIMNFIGKRKLKIKLAFIKFMNDEFKLFYWFFHQSLKIFFFVPFLFVSTHCLIRIKIMMTMKGQFRWSWLWSWWLSGTKKKKKKKKSKKENFLFFFIFEKYKKEINFLILWSSCGAEQLLGNEFSFFTVLLFCFLFFLEFQKNGSIRWC